MKKTIVIFIICIIISSCSTTSKKITKRYLVFMFYVSKSRGP